MITLSIIKADTGGYVLQFTERPSEPVIRFLADKTEPGAWNLGLCKMFADPSFDRAREECDRAMDYLRRHGPFEPHRLALDELESTTMPELERRIAHRWEPLAEPARDSSRTSSAPAVTTQIQVGGVR
jgi:fructose 1,6-bisphosphatase